MARRVIIPSIQYLGRAGDPVRYGLQIAGRVPIMPIVNKRLGVFRAIAGGSVVVEVCGIILRLALVFIELKIMRTF